LRLGLSGFFGLDFMIEERTGDAYLIEMNPRVTPPCHIRLGKGRNLAGALRAQFAHQSIPEDAPVTEASMIAYFPRSSKGNKEVMQNCYQDVPENEPELVQELLNPFPDRTLLFRLVQWLSRTSVQGEFETNASPVLGDFNRQASCEIGVDEELGINSLLRNVGDRPE
jgi:hypothetical protein